MTEPQEKDRGYVLIPHEIACRRDLTPADKLVLGVLIRLQGQNAMSWPSYEGIARLSGLSERQSQRIIANLCELKEIKKIKHSYRSNTYSVPWATKRNIRRKFASQKQASNGDNLSRGG